MVHRVPPTPEEPLVVWSTFSGVGGIDRGLELAGMRVELQAESDDWCRAILAHHWPGVPCLADVRDVGADATVPPAPGLGRPGRPDGAATAHGQHGKVDVLCGGFPCQDVSVAGKRAGLAGERSGLFFEFARIADAVRPRWLLIENVPGLLTSNGGRDFGVVVGTLAEIGYGVAWRVLDSRYFGVPQRRRRVFIVGHLGDDDGPALRALCESCDGSTAPRKTTWQATATRARDSAQADGQRYYIEDGVNGTLKAGGAGGSPPRTDAQDEAMVVTAATLSARSAAERAPGRSLEDDVNLVPTATYALQPDDAPGAKGAILGVRTALAPTIGTGDHTSDRGARVAAATGVRRLTPRECERLQGFPDDWTLVPGVACPDTRRYGAMGNAVTVPVAEWIGVGIIAEHARTDGPARAVKRLGLERAEGAPLCLDDAPSTLTADPDGRNFTGRRGEPRARTREPRRVHSAGRPLTRRVVR